MYREKLYYSSCTLATFVVMNIASYRAIIASFNQPRGDSPRKLNYHTWGSALWVQRVFGGEEFSFSYKLIFSHDAFFQFSN
jgi:hypothetical protein